MNQIELEAEMENMGRVRARASMEVNEEKGRAAMNAYANTFIRRFTIPLAEQIELEKKTKSVGKHKSHVVLLRGLDVNVVALVSVRCVLNLLMKKEFIQVGYSSLATKIGKSIQTELLMEQLKHENNEEFYWMMKKLEDSGTSNERHMEAVTRNRMRKAGIDPIVWTTEHRLKLGAFILSLMETVGMVDSFVSRNGKRSMRYATLSVDCLETLCIMREYVEEAYPYFMPCIEKPLDWVSPYHGGYHTEYMQKKSGPVVDMNRKENNFDAMLEAANVLQSVKWKVNNRVLDIACRLLEDGVSSEEIICDDEKSRPIKPDFLVPGMRKDLLTEEQKLAFKDWKGATARWETWRRARLQKRARMYTTLSIAKKMADFPELYFVYKFDFRGRAYSKTTGLNPQGSDMQRSLLCFAEGKPLTTRSAQEWFMIHGANRYGVDKVSYKDRIKWVKENEELILAVASDPVDNWHLWKDADKPFGFIAWCLEFKDWKEQGPGFVSHLPISMDGTCNGLQNFSGMLKDEVGGEATNLVPSPAPRDIYETVAKVTMRLLEKMPRDEEGFRDGWLKHKINRKIVKRSVMTLPYGSTRFSCANFILKDYMEVVKPEEFHAKDYRKASTFLSFVVWDAIGQVVVAARKGMDWLQKCAELVVNSGMDVEWETPTGFLVKQSYHKFDGSMQIKCNIMGRRALFRIKSGKKVVSKKDNVLGVAPNFVHSFDGSLMQLVSARMKGKSLAMIHDDFGTHAADADELFRVVRDEFIKIYKENNWLRKFKERYEGVVDLPEQPPTGSLDLERVRDSLYFFG